MIGNRDALAARAFIKDLAGRLSNRVQLTTDGHKAYLEAVDEAFGSDIDYAMLLKLYGADITDEARYSLAACIGTKTAKSKDHNFKLSHYHLAPVISGHAAVLDRASV